MNTCYFKMTRSSSCRAGGVNHCGLRREPNVYEHLNTDWHLQPANGERRVEQNMRSASRNSFFFCFLIWAPASSRHTHKHTQLSEALLILRSLPELRCCNLRVFSDELIANSLHGNVLIFCVFIHLKIFKKMQRLMGKNLMTEAD